MRHVIPIVLDVAVTYREAHTGRKEIVMFFYMYAFIELLAFFLDSGVIPSAHASYPVRGLVIFARKSTFDTEHDIFTSGSPQSIPDSWQQRTPVC